MTRKSTVSHIVMLLLPLCGIWPGRSINLITRLFWVVTLAFIGLCHFLYFSSHLDPQNFFNLVHCLSSFLAYAKVFTKLVAFWINEQKLMETLALITDDWNDCSNSEIGVRVTMRKAKLSDRITNAILILHIMTIVGYCLGAILADADVTDETIELTYANKMQLPFNVNTQRTYRFVLIAEFVHLIILNFTASVVNSMLLTLVLHAGGQMEILQSWLSQLISREIINKEESIVIATNKIIRKHIKIIQFSKNIEVLYTYIALLLFASNTVLICSIGFLIVTAIGSPDAMEQILQCLLFFSNTNIEAFIFCYAGEYLSNKSKAIGFAAYNCPWYNLKPKDSRVLLFIILRSQRQLTLTAGKMMDLSLQGFASIMNASGSYLSVLLAMQ
ncbi:unnamed protein product [Lasius platythorax]|uniref:Odorant receptor n=1 Tax=Lasius platythorax TaxID=488582 RepID=A0AAV2N4T8_9HYME